MRASPKTMLDRALDLATQGYRVFPLVANGKTPALRRVGCYEATRDPSQIAKWWASVPQANIGVATGRNPDTGKCLLVIDVDNKNGKSGDAGYAALDMIHDMPATRSARTASQPIEGKHYHFECDEPLSGGNDLLGAGVDVKCDGGYVVGPGSVIEGKEYTWESSGAVAELPRSVAGLLKQRKRTKPAENDNVVPPVVDLDHPQAIARALDYLSRTEPAVEGNAGDETGFKVACRVKDFGVSRAVALDLMLSHWADRCVSSLGTQEFNEWVAEKVTNAYEHGTKPIGAASPQAEFEPVVLEPPPAALPARKLFFELFRDLGGPDSPEPEPLIEDYLDQAAFSVLYGESHVGKTFIALDMAFAVAAGRPWNGKAVTQGAVVYVAAEGGSGIRRRLKALREDLGIQNAPLALVPCSISLVGAKTDTNDLCRLIADAAQQLGSPVRLIVIDTLSRAMAGANENSSEDMTAYVAAVDRIRAEVSAHVMTVHHAGKDTSKGARGHSSLRAATDTELEVEKNTLRVRKQRDDEHAPNRMFRLKPVKLGVNARGKDIGSCVVEWTGTATDDFGLRPLRKGSWPWKLHDTFLRAAKGAAPARHLSRDELKAAFFATYPEALKANAASTVGKRFPDNLEQLFKDGYLLERGDDVCEAPGVNALGPSNEALV